MVHLTTAILAGFSALTALAHALPSLPQQSSSPPNGCGEQNSTEGPESLYANAITSALPRARKLVLDYDGSCDLETGGYQTQLGVAIKRLRQDVEEFVEREPRGRVVLVGYSMGAHVVMGLLGGGVGDGVGALEGRYRKSVAAVVVLGDASFTKNQVYNKGTALSGTGLFPRVKASLQKLDFYKDRIASYCDWGDMACSVGTLPADPNAPDPHGSYFEKGHYVDAGVKFAVEKVKRDLTG